MWYKTSLGFYDLFAPTKGLVTTCTTSLLDNYLLSSLFNQTSQAGKGSKEKAFRMAGFFAAISGKVAALLVAPIGRHVGYFFQFSGNVETLTKEPEKLRNLKDDVKQEVEFAVNNADNILITVETWLGRVDLVDDKAESIINGKTQFPKGCFNNWCLNLKSRYVLSRQAKKRTREIIELQQEGKFPKVSLPAPPVLFMGSTSTTFNSREVFLEEIIKNLKNENISMIVICGMGRVGKTTMVEEVSKRVNKEKMFDDYAKTVVSQKADTAKVQNDIAEMLSLIIKENNPVLRASRLNQRLEGKRVIVILDDVWEEFDLQALGITLQDGQSKCKIVFTSRTQDLWMSLRSRRHEFLLHPLSGNESWNLFKEKIGDFLDDNPEFVTKAEKIVNECAGLPLALVTLARVLLGKGKRTWNDVLVKLRSVSGVQQKVYESIRLSYDHLGDEEAKSLFLLCSLFKEDSQIDVESLVNMGMGLRLFRGINRVEEVRDRVFALVEQLESRCLVSTESINYKAQYFVKVHDVVRDVSKSIASTSRGSLVIEHDVTDYNTPLEQSFDEHHTWISVISNFTVLPLMLPLPRLKLLRCSSDFLEISDSCFEGMVDLQVVDMTLGFDMSGFLTLKLPSSFQFFTSLRTLCLQYFRFTDFTPIKFLKSLEILRIVDTGIEEMPKEIGQLTKLRLLDMSECENLKKASSGIISGLSNLEELYLGGLNIDWGAEETEKDGNPVHTEFELLFNLHILQIVIRDPQILPRTPVLGDLKKYQILVGGFKEKLRDESDFLKDSQNYERILSVCNVDLDKDLNLFVRNSEALLLKGKSAIRLVYELVRWASPSIRCLEIRKTDTPETLVDVTGITKAPFLVSNLESLTLHSLNKLHQVTNGPLVAENIANLKKLVVRDCKHLRNVLWVSNASDVLHLEKLHVSRCESMGEVIVGREEKKTQLGNYNSLN